MHMYVYGKQELTVGDHISGYASLSQHHQVEHHQAAGHTDPTPTHNMAGTEPAPQQNRLPDLLARRWKRVEMVPTVCLWGCKVSDFRRCGREKHPNCPSTASLYTIPMDDLEKYCRTLEACHLVDGMGLVKCDDELGLMDCDGATRKY